MDALKNAVPLSADSAVRREPKSFRTHPTIMGKPPHVNPSSIRVSWSFAVTENLLKCFLRTISHHCQHFFVGRQFLSHMHLKTHVKLCAGRRRKSHRNVSESFVPRFRFSIGRLRGCN